LVVRPSHGATWVVLRPTANLAHALPLSNKSLDSHFFDGRRSPC
jgi:hypothetical protein